MTVNTTLYTTWRAKHCGQIKSKQLNPPSELPQRSKMITYQLLTPVHQNLTFWCRERKLCFPNSLTKTIKKTWTVLIASEASETFFLTFGGYEWIWSLHFSTAWAAGKKTWTGIRTLTSPMLVQCSPSWAIRPTGGRSCWLIKLQGLLVEHCIGITEVRVWIPIQVWIFQAFLTATWAALKYDQIHSFLATFEIQGKFLCYHHLVTTFKIHNQSRTNMIKQ